MSHFVILLTFVWRHGGCKVSADRAVRVRVLAGDIELRFWARHFTLTVPLSTQVYRWVLANLKLGVASHPGGQ